MKPTRTSLRCKFTTGQIIHHLRYRYRGVIFDVDPQCQADEDWYKQNKTQPKRDQPWYHVLVDNSDQTTYVAEENIEPDYSDDPIQHPCVHQFFSKYDHGSYIKEFDA